MSFEKRSHGERLQKWATASLGNLSASNSHERWVSPLLPTKRFGPDAWASFAMHSSPRSADVGEFLSWTAFDAHSLRLVAYLGRPLADTFGVVAPFEKGLLDSSKIESSLALDRLADAFWADAPVLEADRAELVAIMHDIPPQIAAALETSSSDFFGWLRW